MEELGGVSVGRGNEDAEARPSLPFVSSAIQEKNSASVNFVAVEKTWMAALFHVVGGQKLMEEKGLPGW